MGRSRITRTFHNKPVSKPKKGPIFRKSKNTVVKPTNTTYTRGKRIDPRPINPEKSKPRGPEKVKNNPTQRGNLLPQAHAQEAPKQKTKSKKESLEGKNLRSLNISTQILSRHSQNQGSHNYHGFTPLHGDGPHNSNWSLGSDDVKHISGRTKSINKQRVGYFGKQQGNHLDQSRATTPDGKDAGIIETVIRTKTGFRAFGKGKSLSLSKSNIKKEKYASGELVNVQYGMNPYTPASDTEGRAIDKKYYPDETATGKKRTILGKFAQGVSNEAQDMVGIPHGFITGNNYKTKSILSRATEHVLAGDWGSAGSVISNNPYRFAGNIATTVGTGFIPFGAVTRGAGLAARVGSAVTKGKSKIAGKLKGKGAEKKSYAGGKYTNKEINDAERLVQQSEWMGWGKVKSRQTGLGFSEKVYKKKGAVSRHKNRKEQRVVDAEQATERRIDNFAGRSTGTPKWYQPREQFLAKTKGSRARLSRDRQQAEIRGSENRYNARIADNYENTKPTKNSFWQNQVTKDGDDVSGWVDPDFFR